MYRENGSIPVLKNARYPSRLMVFDTEAYRGEVIDGLELQTFRMAVTRFIKLDKALTILEDEVEFYQDTLTLYQSIERQTRKDKTLFLYAHNIKYDLQLSGLLTLFLENGWRVGTFVFDDPPTFVRLSRNRSVIMMVDTFNYWQYSLARMGEQLSLAKLPMPGDDASYKDWCTYCRRDVDVLTSYILSFIRYLKENDLCGLGLTLASQSMRAYRHKFMSVPIIIHNRHEAIDLEREGYSGGRVEAFHIGDLPAQTYYKLDVNSMYPYVMSTETYPNEFVGYSENIPLAQLRRLLARYYLIGEFEINTNQSVYPYKSTHKLLFPVGTFRTVLHSPEIYYALDNNHIVSIPRLAAYHSGDLFSEYIDYFYQMKLDAETNHNPVVRQQAKILMNSLYGKFGQQEVISRILPNETGIQYGRLTGYSETLGHKVSINCLGSDMEVSYKEGESPYSFPGIAGAVTAYARLYLYRLMTIANLENVYYVDTDSLIVNQTGVDNLKEYLDPYRLGMLKIEDTSDKLVIWGAKDYQFGEEIKHKGVPKSAQEISIGKWQYEQFRGASTWLRDGLNTGVHVYTRIKERKSAYDKGTVDTSGNVSPLVFR